jgi:hypothetical protein
MSVYVCILLQSVCLMQINAKIFFIQIKSKWERQHFHKTNKGFFQRCDLNQKNFLYNFFVVSLLVQGHEKIVSTQSAFKCLALDCHFNALHCSFILSLFLYRTRMDSVRV